MPIFRITVDWDGWRDAFRPPPGTTILRIHNTSKYDVDYSDRLRVSISREENYETIVAFASDVLIEIPQTIYLRRKSPNEKPVVVFHYTTKKEDIATIAGMLVPAGVTAETLSGLVARATLYGYEPTTRLWHRVYVTTSGEFLLPSTQPVKVSGETLRIQGYDYISGVWRDIGVDRSGQLQIRVEVTDIVTAKVSGETVIAETSGAITRVQGYDYVGGTWRDIGVDESGQLQIKVTVADIVTAKISGEQVDIFRSYKASGGVVTLVGATQSTLIRTSNDNRTRISIRPFSGECFLGLAPLQPGGPGVGFSSDNSMIFLRDTDSWNEDGYIGHICGTTSAGAVKVYWYEVMV